MDTFIGIPADLVGVDMWVLTERPADFPCSYVLRHGRAAPTGMYYDPVPVAVTATADEARRAVPTGLALVETRETAEPLGGDPVILEVWA